MMQPVVFEHSKPVNGVRFDDLYELKPVDEHVTRRQFRRWRMYKRAVKAL